MAPRDSAEPEAASASELERGVTTRDDKPDPDDFDDTDDGDVDEELKLAAEAKQQDQGLPPSSASDVNSTAPLCPDSVAG